MQVGNYLVGWGMSTAINPAPRYPAEASATMFADGTVLVQSATSDMGPGTYTAVTQIAAEELGLSLHQVRFELGDSMMPKAPEHGGSTTLATIGNAVRDACQALKKELEDLAEREGDNISNPLELMRRAKLKQLDAKGSAAPGEEKTKYSSYSFGAVFAEVHVHAELFTIHVQRIVGAYDVGKVINPKLARSQCLGGMVGGIGMALLEEAVWDDRFGKVMNPSLAEYLVPVNADVGELEALFIPGEDTITNPLGVKGVAELALCGVAPAIANAVWHATGKRIRELPITLDKLL